MSKPTLYALLMAGLIALLVLLYTNTVERNFYSKWGGAKRVVIAGQDIAEGTLLDASMLREETVPANFTQPGGFEKVEDAKGKTVASGFTKGEQIVSSKIVSSASELGLAVFIPEGKKAVSIAANEVTGVGGLLAPGNRVDVLGTFSTGSESVTTTVLSDAKVLAVNRTMSLRETRQKSAKGILSAETVGDHESRLEHVTLAVTLEEAQRLVLAQEVGTVTIVLRSPWDKSSAIGGRQQSSTLIGTPVARPEKPVWRIWLGEKEYAQ